MSWFLLIDFLQLDFGIFCRFLTLEPYSQCKAHALKSHKYVHDMETNKKTFLDK